VDWIKKETGKPYRLLSEAEWEYAARGRTQPGAYPHLWFGDDEKELCRYGNSADQKRRESLGPKDRTAHDFLKGAPCNDGYSHTSPAGHYTPNSFDLYDMAGNAQQWTADCWHDSYAGAPADGSAWTSGDCSKHVIRGGSWENVPAALRAPKRIQSGLTGNGNVTGFRAEGNVTGFRVARTLVP
jgi:formylglycine-generating enzyme required for sulfatase activity